MNFVHDFVIWRCEKLMAQVLAVNRICRISGRSSLRILRRCIV